MCIIIIYLSLYLIIIIINNNNKNAIHFIVMFQEDTFKRFDEKIKLTFRLLLQTMDFVIRGSVVVVVGQSAGRSSGRMKWQKDAKDDDDDDEVGKWVW